MVLSIVLLIGYFALQTSFFVMNGEETKNNSNQNQFEQEEGSNDEMISQKENSLPIPPLLENETQEEGKAEFTLNVQHGKTEFLEGYEADTLGYNGDYLGPVIQVKRGDDVKINVKNELDEATTVHWHGLEVIGEMDGGPHQGIDPNDSWTPEFTIDQPAATLWYHPHSLGKTGEQVYKGLAGLFYIEDEFSEALDIPKEYGINDIPLVVQDKRFTEDGQIPYRLTMPDRMNGFKGDTVLMNGAIHPQLNVKNEVIRLRILNGSNARSYDFNFEDGTEFYQIASDGGFLEESVPMNHLVLAPAERAEILVDLSDYKQGDELHFKDANHELMTLYIADEGEGSSEIPEELAEIEHYKEEDVVRSREFVMSGMGPMVTINGKQMDMDRIDEYVNTGELEEWIVTNDSGSNPMGGGMMGGMASTPHPFHVHATQFQVIERNGEEPAPNESGWKDTVMIHEDENVRLLVKFEKEGLFMYHCHILEHEDAGMMGQFLVE